MTTACFKEASRIREFEQLLLKLFGEGKLNGTVHTCVGQELIPVLLTEFITDKDTFFSNHRGHGHYIAKTGDVKGLLAEVMGKKSGCSGGYGGSQHLVSDKGFYSNGIQGGMAPIAAGYAFSRKISGEEGISVQFIGDGTLGEGTLYEAMNCSSVYKLPVLFVMENNGYAQSTCSSQTFAGSTLQRFEGFGLRYFSGNIWDQEKLTEQLSKAVESARNFEPAIIEVNCYRLNSHSKSDDNRDHEEIKEHIEKDPLNKFKKEHPAVAEKILQEINSELNQYLRELDNDPVLGAIPEYDKITISETAFQPLAAPEKADRINDLIYQAFRDRLVSDKHAVLIGEDIENSNDYNPKPYGGAFKVTKDLSNLCDRVFNTPISEAAITGIGIGLALGNKLAISEIMFGDFTTLTLDQVLQHASKFQGMYGRKLNLPFILRTPMGGKRGYGPTHSQSLEKHFLGIYGFHVTALNYRVDPGDFYTNLFKVINAPHLVIENKIDYTRYFNTPFIPTHEYMVSSGTYPVLKVKPKHLEPRITVFCYGGMLADAEAAAEELFMEHEIPVEIICPTSLFPFDLAALKESVEKTGKLLTIEEGASFAALGSEVIAQLVTAGVVIKKAAQVGNNSIIPSSFAAEIKLLPEKNRIINTILKM